MEDSLAFTSLNLMNLCYQSQNILMDEHNNYSLQVYGGMFEVLSESSS